MALANAPSFPIDKKHPDGTAATPGHDPIIGQVVGPRTMDEILPNYPTGNARSTLTMPDPFVVPTAAGYFFHAVDQRASRQPLPLGDNHDRLAPQGLTVQLNVLARRRRNREGVPKTRCVRRSRSSSIAACWDRLRYARQPGSWRCFANSLRPRCRSRFRDC